MTSHRTDVKPPGLEGDPLAFKVLNEISIIAQLSENHFARLLPEGLTVAQFGVLNHLLRLEREETVSQLASAFQVSVPTMSSTVRKLEDKAFIAFKEEPTDRRVKRVTVTAAGKAIRQESVARLDEARPLFERIPAEHWQTILPILTDLRALLDAAR